MYKVAIVEDEEMYVKQLTEYLTQYGKEFGRDFDITVFNDGDDIVHRYNSQFDLILMDVQMKFMDGMSAAEEIRKVDQEVVIVFITNMAQYAIKGYEVDAMDYILKPINYFAFSQRLERVLGRMKKREGKMIVISVKGGSVRKDINEVYYVESQGHTLLFHTKGEVLETSGTMKDVEEQLLPLNFFRGNKGYLINLAAVESVEESEATVKGEKLALSRGRKKEFMEALTRYWGETMK